MSSLSNILVSAGAGATAAFLVGGMVLRVLKHAVGNVAKEVVTKAIEDLKRKVDDRFDANDDQTKANGKETADLKLEFAREFGGNSGGMRQAINALQKDVATLSGKFEQHTKEATE